jgi:class 3 adenylate cyclase/tetratricopeptide (TPR) repeat protein/energy-coupling factor transporter ATP-binding protein EcfA2
VALRQGQTIGAFLAGLGLSAYDRVFAEQGIDAEVLPDLTDTDLQALGLPLGPRKKILKAIAALRADVESPPPGATTPPPRHGAERRNMTLLFCDMVSSTTLATHLDPEELRTILHRYMDTCTQVIEDFGGYVASYHGDGLMAFFGYPQAREDAAERAVRASLRLVATVAELYAFPDVPLQARIGIATGLAVVGDLIGDGATREDAVVGQPPALAVRLQSLAPPGGIIASQATRELLGGMFILEPLGPQQLKGFDTPQPAWQVLGANAIESRFAAAGRNRPAAMVGRAAEIARLQACWRLAEAGQGQVVLLAGEAGFGKSRLIQAMREAIDAQSHDLVLLQCASYSQSSALRPVIDWIERTAGFTAEDPPAARRQLLDALPGLTVSTPSAGAARLAFAELLGLEKLPAQADQVAWRERTLAALSEYFARSAIGGARLLVIEDAHWSDAVTLELIERLAAHAAALKLMIVISARPDSRLPAFTGTPHTTISLDRLGAAETVQMIETLGADRLADELREQIAARAGGVPLFIEELTRSVLEGQGGTVSIPATLRDTLMARLDRLGAAKAIAQTGAVLGRRFSHRWLTGCASAEPAHLKQCLDQLTLSGLLTARGEPPDAVYTFRHALTQDAAYESMLRTERMRKHGEVARMLEVSVPGIAEDQPELIAHHYTEGGESEPAIGWWQRAAARAVGQGAWVEAAGHLKAALGLLARRPEGPERDQQEIELRKLLIGPLVSIGGYSAPETQQNIDRLAELLENAPASLEGMIMLSSEATRLLERSELDRAEAVAARALQIGRRCGVPNAPFPAQRVLGYSALLRGKLALADHWFTSSGREYDPTVNRAIRAGAPLDPYSSTMSQDVPLRVLQGRFREARERGEAAYAEAERFGSPTTLAYVLAHLGLASVLAGDTGRATQIAAALSEPVERAAWLRPHLENLLGWIEIQAGDVAAGIARLDQTIELWERVQSRMWLPLQRMTRATALLQGGELERALAALDAADRTAEQCGQAFFLAETQRMRGEIYRLTGDPRATEALLAALDTAQRQGAGLFALRAAANLATLRDGAHDAVLAEVLAAFDDGSDLPDLRAARRLLNQHATAQLP